MSMNLLFEMSRRSFRALDAAMNVTGQNVANAETEGYARRRVTLQPEGVSALGIHARPVKNSVLGAGVSVSSYERMRDGLVQRAGWEMEAGIGYAEEEQRVLGSLEGLFPVGSEGALNTQLGQFWNAWSDLADNPNDNGVRLALRSRAAGLASTLNRLDGDARKLQSETQTALADGIAEANGLLERIARLNETIATAGNTGSPNLDAADERDRLIDRLAGFAPIRVAGDGSGAVTVTLDGITVVQDRHAQRLALDTSTQPPAVRFEGTDVTLRTRDGGGRLGGWMRMLEETLPNTLTALDDLAATLVSRVNGVHTTGFGMDGTPPGTAFFDTAGVTAATIDLSAAVKNDSKKIVASSTDPTTGVQDGALALAIAGLRDDKMMGGGTATAETFVIDLVSGVGADLSKARQQYDARSTAATHLDAMEQGVSGVSIEEEMTNLIQYQHAFQASTRVLNTVQQMLDTLLSL